MNNLEREELAFRLAQQAAGKQLKAEMESDPKNQALLDAIKAQKKPPSEH